MITPVALWRRGKYGDRRARIVLGIRILAAVVWFGFGVIFKVIGAVPRHQEIVAAILGSDIAAADYCSDWIGGNSARPLVLNWIPSTL
jgi:hypothetical protein